MLSKVKLTNFRKHQSLEHSFQEGFSVLRGANEAGKSTVFEAVAYAIFGVGALRTPLDKTVTWGHPESSLRVELWMTIDHTEYHVKRSKSGAEVNYAGGSVTGQKEVTKFLGGLMRMDIAAAKRLILSNQKEIAGALEAGPKATTEMIERLADFHQIDRLLELMEEKLSLGSGAALQARLEAAQHQLEASKGAEEPNWAALDAGVKSAEADLAVQVGKVSEAQSTFDTVQEAAAKASAAQSERENLDRREKRLQERYSAAMAELQSLRANPVEAPDNADDRIQALMKEKAEIEVQARISRIYESVKHLCGKQEIDYFLGTKEEFQARMDHHKAAITSAQSTILESKHQIDLLRKDIETGSCTFCGKDFSDLPEVKAKNEAIQAKIDAYNLKIDRARESIDQSEPHLERLMKIKALAKAYEDVASKHHEYVVADWSKTYPPVLGWTSVGLSQPDGQKIDDEIRTIRAHQTRHREYLAAVKANDDLLESFCPERDDIQKRRETLGEASSVDHAAMLTEARRSLQEARDGHTRAAGALSEAKGLQRDERRRWDQCVAAVEAARKVVESSEAEIKTLDFNNALLKRVRAARPAIADQLWNLVLTSVSTYFSEIRGTPSTVTKGADGFQIDGEPVESFSGSTIDALGLAIRVALVRTFLPTAPFLILDEPAAACSAERTENMLGFILGSGFKQVLLVTHEDVSEGVADHITTIGEEA